MAIISAIGVKATMRSRSTLPPIGYTACWVFGLAPIDLKEPEDVEDTNEVEGDWQQAVCLDETWDDRLWSIYRMRSQEHMIVKTILAKLLNFGYIREEEVVAILVWHSRILLR